MASEPATSSDGDRSGAGPAIAVTGEAAFAARLSRRATPVVRTPLNAARAHQPGRMAGTFGTFNNRLGLSQTSRWTLDAATAATADDIDHVRPPINYWPWDDEEPAASQLDESPPQPRAPVVEEPDNFVASGDDKVDALRRLLSKGKPSPTPARPTGPTGPTGLTAAAARPPAPRPRRPVRRGLPQVLHRRGSALRRAQPGDIARRLQPAAVDPRSMAARPANGSLPANLPAAAAQARAVETAERGATNATTRQNAGTPRAGAATPASRTPPPDAAAPQRQDAGRIGPLAASAPVPPWLAQGNSSSTAGPDGGAQPAAPARRAVDLAGAAREQQRSASMASPPEPRRATAAPSPAAAPVASTPNTPAPASAPGASAPRAPAPVATSAPPAPNPAAPATTPPASPPPAAPKARPATANPADGVATVRRATGSDRAAGTAGALVPGTATGPVGRARDDSGRGSAPAGRDPVPGETPVRGTDLNSQTRSTPGPAAAEAVGRAARSPLASGDGSPPASPATDGGARSHRVGDTALAPDATRRHEPSLHTDEPARLPNAPAPVADAARSSLASAGEPWSPADATPRPPVATAGAGPVAADGPTTPHRQAATDGTRDASRPATSQGTPHRPATDRPSRRADASAPASGDAPVRRLADHTPSGLTTTAPSASISGPKASVQRVTPAAEPGPGRAAATTGDRPTPSSTAGPLRRTAEDTATHRPAGSTSSWPAQPTLDPASADVELGARTRAPSTSTIDSFPADGTIRRTLGLDAETAPAPPLTPRLRAVEDRAVGDSPADTPLASRYRPTWQGDPITSTDRPAGRETGTAAPRSGGPAATTARGLQRFSPAAPGTTERTGAAPTTRTATAGPVATPAYSRLAPDASPAPATTEPAVRRAPLADTTVRPALAPSPGAPAAAGSPGAGSPDGAAAAGLAAGSIGTVARAHDARSTSPTAPATARRVEALPTDRSPATATTPPAPTARADRVAPSATPDRAVNRTPSTGVPAPAAARTAGPASAPDVAGRAPTQAPDVVRLGEPTRDVADRIATPASDVARRDLAVPSTMPDVQRSIARADGPVARADGPVARADGPVAAPPRPAPPAVRRTEAGRDEAGGTAAAPAAPEHRFESILRRAPAAPAPLPVQWRPLASAIAGQRRVRVSTNAASRAALQAAGKRAATTGDVIHLAQPLRGPADAPVLAHELTHVAAPSPAPRFFDDDRDSPEERRAEMIADVIRRSPVLPRPSAGATSAHLGAPRPAPVVRRSATSAAAPTTTADDLVRRLTAGPGRPGGADTIRRRVTAGGHRTAPARTATPATTTSNPGDAPPGGSASNAGPATTTTTSTDTSTTGSDTSTSTGRRTRSWPMMTNGLDSSSLHDLTDWIVEQVEQRVIRELERRGGRYRGEF